MSQNAIETMLCAFFPKKHVTALIRHFQEAAERFQRQEWEDSIAKDGKFIEAVLKALHVYAMNQPAPSGKAFKADTVMNALGGLPRGGEIGRAHV